MKTANIPNTTKRRLAVYFNYAGKDIDPNIKCTISKNDDEYSSDNCSTIMEICGATIVAQSDLEYYDSGEIYTETNKNDIELSKSSRQKIGLFNKVFHSFRKKFFPNEDIDL